MREMTDFGAVNYYFKMLQFNPINPLKPLNPFS